MPRAAKEGLGPPGDDPQRNLLMLGAKPIDKGFALPSGGRSIESWMLVDGDYLILYRVRSDDVQIVRVLHKARESGIVPPWPGAVYRLSDAPQPNQFPPTNRKHCSMVAIAIAKTKTTFHVARRGGWWQLARVDPLTPLQESPSGIIAHWTNRRDRAK